MWVPKNPRPDDFCGLIPCPQCHDYLNGMGIVRDGIEKLQEEMQSWGAGPVTRAVAERAAACIHAEKRAMQREHDEAIQARNFEGEKEMLDRQIAAMAAAKGLRAKKIIYRPVLDHLDLDAEGNIKKPAKQAEKVKAPSR